MSKHKDTKTQRHKGAFKQVFKHAFVPVCLCVFVVTAFTTQRTPGTAAAIRFNNLGVAYMNQARIGEALQAFRRAAAQDQALFAARLNEGIALLNGQKLAEAFQISDAHQVIGRAG